MLIYILIYGIGTFLCYYLFRFIMKQQREDNWVLTEKLITMMLSLGSWASILAYLSFLAAIFIFKVDPDKKVKW